MPAPTTSRVSIRRAYQPLVDDHLGKYLNYSCCSLCEGRTTRCLFRGQIPADVLYVGEGPGDSEDVCGFPFVGPAGDKLNAMIFAAERHALLRDDLVSDEEYKQKRDSGELMGLRHVFGNLVACIPKNDRGTIRQPTKPEIMACQPQLVNLVYISQPKIIVLCGLLPQKHFPKSQINFLPHFQEYVEVIHPSSILRIENDDPQAAGLAYKRTILALSAAYQQLSRN